MVTGLAAVVACGIPNNGDLHVVERIHPAGAGVLLDELAITVPHTDEGNPVPPPAP